MAQILRNKSARMFKHGFSLRRSVFTDAWKMPSMEKEKIGSRTLILSDASDALSTESARRMAYEMQLLGIQPVMGTMNTPFPTDKILDENVSLLRRTGAKSITAVGSAALIDAAKAVRFLAETGTKRVSDASKPQSFKESMPLLCVATSISPVNSLSAWGVLHHEDDVLVKRWGHAPEVIASDPKLIQQSSTYIPEASLCYLLAALFDDLVAVSLFVLQSNSRATTHNAAAVDLSPALLAKIVRKLLKVKSERKTFKKKDGDSPYVSLSDPDVLISAITASVAELSVVDGGTGKRSKLLLEPKLDLSALVRSSPEAGGSGNDTDRTSGLADVADTLGRLRSQIHTNSELSSTQWPGVVETGALLLALNVESEVTLPFSWVVSSIFRDLVAVLLTESVANGSEYSRPDDVQLLTALNMSLTAMQELSGVSLEDLAKLSSDATSLIGAKIRQTPKKFRRAVLKGSKGLGSDNYHMVSPASHLEKLIALEEMAADQAANELHAATGTNNINEKVVRSEASLRLRVLKSDFMLDFVEKIMK